MATALYRRYRPESFADVIGQDHVTTPLKRALRAGRVGHAYLFSGPRGCGKTTSARILARCLNCAQGPTDTPCGTCDSCRDLSRGGPGSLDVVEIDAASHGGVDDARELRERATFAPARDRYKVFIIDEAHMVTSAGFNALLKLVEEPPEHVKFVFATTEPDKVIGTIRSRTHHYPFRLIPPQVLLPYLEQVCDAEGVQVGEGVLPLVVRAGGGSARDTMSVLDQLMAGAGDEGLDHHTAIALLGFTDTALLDQAITAVAQRDGAGMYAAVEQVLATGHEPRRFVEDLLERIRDLIVLAAVPDRGEDLLPQVPAEDLEQMRQQAASFQPADLSRCGDLVHETLSTMSGATSPRLHLELLAARLVLREERGAAAPVPGGGAPAQASAPAGGSGREQARRIAQERADAARRAREGEQQGAPRAEPPRQERAASQAAPAPAPVQRPAAAQAASDDGWGEVAVPGGGRSAASGASAAPVTSAPAAPVQPDPVVQAPVEQPPVEEAPGQAPAPATGGGGISAEELRGHWSAIMDELAQIRRPTWALVAQNGHVQEVRGTTLVLGFRTPGLLAAFHRGTNAENLSAAVRRVTRQQLAVEAVVAEDPGSGGAPGGPGGQAGPGGQTGPGGQAGGGTGWAGPAGPDRSGRPGAGRPAGPEASAAPPQQGAWGAAAGREERGAARPAGREHQGPSAPQGGFAPEPDLPPEPEDPYPPDPYEEDQRSWQPAGPAAATAVAPARSAEPAAAPAPSTAPQPPAWGDVVAEAPPEQDVLVVEERRRDAVPDGEPRTHGQEALRRAIAEDRVVRTRELPMEGGAPEPAAVPEPAAAPEPVGWDAAPVAAAAPPAEATAPAPTGQASGAELARRAAQASRLAAQERSRQRSAPSAAPASASAEPEDPTGGASRDDADATVTRRSGREVVEKLLGGRVLEVIDETKG